MMNTNRNNNSSLRKQTELNKKETSQQQNIQSQQEDALSQENIDHVIKQFQRKGFESLSLENLAIATIHQDFSQSFKNATGMDWQSKFQIKAIERLNYAQFDINWLTRKSDDYFKPLFQNVIKGDLARVQSFVNSCPKDMNCLKCVDQTKKSPVHIAAAQGHQSVLEYLIHKGFNVDARDRTLKTPLHYACMNGFETAADYLLKNGADIQARDSTGKNPIHFAATSNSSQLITLLVAIKPDIVFSKDNSGLTGLHYAVWNASQKAVEIARSLLDYHANVNDQDDDGKTALHHASKGGRNRVIPILIQRGADITIRDTISKKTPLEIAASDRTRELIIVYSSTPLSHTTQTYPNNNHTNNFNNNNNTYSNNNNTDLAWINTALKGTKLPILPMPKDKSPEPPKKINPYNEDVSAISSWIRGRFFKLMKKLQEEGLKNWHHLKKPYIYTGSWMEGIKNLEELYDLIKDIPPSEAIIRAFNILCPYDKEIPRGSGEEEAIDNFYGSSWYEGGSYNYSKRLETDKRLGAQNEIDEQINSLKMALTIREKALEDSELQNVDLIRKNKDLDRLLSETKSKLNTLIDEQKKSITQKDEKLKQLNIQVSNLQRDLNAKEMEISEMKANEAEITNEELASLREQLEKLNVELNELREKEKMSRFKAGQMFLSAINDKKQAKANAVSGDYGSENLQDDDAIIRLYQALRNNPPSLLLRMQQADIDGDNKLSQTEFMLFLEKLRLSPQDIQSLCRVAGFMDGKNLLEIKDFKNILEERPKMREIWEKKLFKRILDAIKAKGLQVETVFSLIDVDNNQMITPQELRNGLESLKIILNQKDFNNLFTIFDENKNGILSLEEMKITLMKHENEVIEVDISFADRIAKDEYDINQALDANANEVYASTFNDISQSIIKFSDDVNPIDGDLKIQIPYANNLVNQSNIKQVTIRIMLRGSEEPHIFKSMILFDTKSWNYVTRIPIRSVLKENVRDDLHIQLYTEEQFVEEFFLGEVKILWKHTIDNPNLWAISQEFTLANVSYKKQNTKEVSGKIAVQLKWIPAESKDFKAKLVQKDIYKQEDPQFTRTLVEAGMLEFVIVSAHLHEKKENLKCSIKTPDKKETIYDAKYDAKGQPYWSQKYITELKSEAEKLLDSIRVTIYYQEGTIFKNKNIIGEVFVNWEECINFPGEFLTRKSYLFRQHPHVAQPSKVYVQMRWIPESLYRTLGGFKQGSLQDRKKDVKASKEDLKEGILKVLLVRAKDLRGDDAVDSSDPYVKLLFQNYDKQIEISSKVKKYTVNPAWYQILQLKISYYKDGIAPPLKVEIWDKDTLSDDSLGSVIVDITPSIEAPCTWAIDDYFIIEDPKYKAPATSPDAKPRIYLQTYFVPEGTVDPNIKPLDKENEMQIREENTICGQLKVKLIHARELRKADKNGSDPYVQINFPNNKEHKSNTISNTLNPQWNEVFMEKILIPKDRLAPLKFIVKDSDFLASDDILGYANVDWSKCIEEPGVWSVNNVFELEGTADIKQKVESLGFIYVQIKFIEEGMIDDQSNPPLIENLAQMIADRQGLYKGTLRVFLIHCRDIVKADDGEKDFSDAYVIFKVPGGKQVKSNVIKDDQFPTWKQIYDIPIFMPKNTIQPMRVEVIDDDLFGNDLMGYVNVDLKEALNSPQKWAINNIFPLDGDQTMVKKYKTDKFGVIYLQVMFVVDGIKNDDKPLPLIEDMDEIIRKKKEEAKIPMRGTIVVNVVMAQNLKIADSSSKSSDPYVEITFPDKKTVSTSPITENLNPIWNFEHRHRIDIYQEANKPLLFKVLDKDTMAVDDVLGQVSVDWTDCFKNPTMWRINNFYDLEGEKVMGQNLGKLYVQVKFLRDEDLETVEGKAQCKTLQELQEEYGRVIGNLHVNILSGANLKNTDFLGKTDPYVKAYLSTNPQITLSTTPLKDNLNPEWNFNGIMPVNILRCQIKSAELFLDVYDEDNFKDELIGRVIIDVISILEQPNKDISFEDIIQDIKIKEGTNYGTLRTSFKWEPSNDCESVQGLRVPEVILKGELFVNIENGRNIKNKALLGKSDPRAQISFNLFSKLTFQSKVFDNNLNPDFKFVNIIPLELTMKKAKQLRLNYSIRDKQVLGSTALCGASLALSEYFEKPGKWLNEYIELRDDDGKPDCGHSFIQIQWRQSEPNISPPIDTTIPQVLDYQEFLKQGEPPKFPGNLFVKIIGARKLKSTMFDKSDPFAEVKISKGDKKVIKTKVIDDNENPTWDHSDQFRLELSEEDWDTLKLYISVYDYDFTLNDKLGSVEIQLKEYFYDKEYNWFDQIMPLLNEKQFPGAGELYVQFQWRQDGQDSIWSKKEMPMNKFNQEQEIEKKKQEEIAKKKAQEDAEPFVSGILYFNIISARNLIKADVFDQSDPFVQVSFNFQKITFNTPVINDNPDPVWNFTKDVEISFQPSKVKDPQVMFTVFDYDYNANDFLGQMIVNIDHMMKDPTIWFNEIQQLQDEKCTKGKNGIFYAQMQWRPTGNNLTEQQKQIPQIIPIESFYKGVVPVGTVVIAAISAENILGVENKGKSSDAQLHIKFNDKKKTKDIPSLNPEWKEVFKFPINYKDKTQMPFLYCELKDWNRISDTFLGDFECDITQILEKPNVWAIEKKFALNNLKKQKVPDEPTGTVFLKIAFLEKGKENTELPL